MVTIEEREAYLRNPFFKEEDRIKGDFTPFYITIAACTLLALFLFVLNLICGCCSKYREYWNDRHTGNRWLVTIFTCSPHKTPPLDLEELANVKIDYPKSFYPGEIEQAQDTYDRREQQRTRRAFGSPFHHQGSVEYTQVAHQKPHQPVAQSPRAGEEFVELQKRESAI